MLFFSISPKKVNVWIKTSSFKRSLRHNPVWKKQIKNISSFNAATAVLRWNIESSTYAFMFMYTWNKKSFQYYFLFPFFPSHMNLYFFLSFFCSSHSLVHFYISRIIQWYYFDSSHFCLTLENIQNNAEKNIHTSERQRERA